MEKNIVVNHIFQKYLLKKNKGIILKSKNLKPNYEKDLKISSKYYIR